MGTLCWAKQTIMSRALCTVNYSDPVMEIQTMVSLSMFLRERQSCSRRPSCSTTTSSNLSSSCSLAKHTHLTFQQQMQKQNQMNFYSVHLLGPHRYYITVNEIKGNIGCCHVLQELISDLAIPTMQLNVYLLSS